MFHVEARRAITRPEIRDRLRVAYGTAAAGSRATVVERFAERITPQELKSPRYTPGQLGLKAMEVRHIAGIRFQDGVYTGERLDQPP